MDKEKDKDKSDKSDKIEMKALMESAAVADYLTALAKGFKSGRIVVEKDGESLTLTPAETAEVEVEARVKKDKARFSLEVAWRLAQAQDEPASLKISAEPGKAETCCKKEEKKEEKKPEAAKVAEVKKPETSKPEAHKPEAHKMEAPKPAAPAGQAPASAQAQGKAGESKPATLPVKS